LINYRYTDFNEINGVKIGQFQSLRKFVRKHESYMKWDYYITQYF